MTSPSTGRHYLLVVAHVVNPERHAQWLRGVLDLLVLSMLSRVDSTYGYALVRDLEAEGVSVKGGTLYPLLSRLEQDCLVSTRWLPGEGGPGRKWFEITARGRHLLAEESTGWCAFSRTVEQILKDQSVAREKR